MRQLQVVRTNALSPWRPTRHNVTYGPRTLRSSARRRAFPNEQEVSCERDAEGLRRRLADIGGNLSYEAVPRVIVILAATSAASYWAHRQCRAGTNTTWLKVQLSVSRTGASGLSKPLRATTSFSTCPTWMACDSKTCARDRRSHSTKAKVPRAHAQRTSDLSEVRSYS